MPRKKHVADALQLGSLQGLLKTRGHPHLRVRGHGVLLVVESGPENDPVAHVRFRRHGAHIWTLEVATHTGAWEPTFLRGQIEKLVLLLDTEFAWTIEPIA